LNISKTEVDENLLNSLLSSLNNLSNLECKCNKLENLNLSKNNNLLSLDCSHNEITSLILSDNCRIVRLNASYNYLNNFREFMKLNMKMIKEFDISNNNIMNGH